MTNPEMGDEMIDLRYHIATVAALFLALGLGIFIGNTMISDGIILREQEQLIVSLEKEFDRLRDDNRFLRANVTSLQESLNAYDGLGKEIFPILAQSKLENKNIGLIVTNPDFNTDRFIGILIEAGVEGVHQISIAKEFFLQDKSEKLVSDIIDTIIDFIVFSEQEQRIEIGTGSEFVNGSFTKPVDYLLIVGGYTIDSDLGYANMLDLSLVEAIIKFEMPIIGIQLPDDVIEIPIIENVDSFIGKVRLIQVLENNFKKEIYGL